MREAPRFSNSSFFLLDFFSLHLSLLTLVQFGDINRLVASFKNVLAREIEALGELRPLLIEEEELEDLHESNGTAGDEKDKNASTSSARGTPKKLPSTYTFYANSPNKEAPLAGFSPYSAITPSKRSHNEIGSLSSTTTLLNSTSNSINNSLSVLAKYILIAAFLASSNPSKKDITMLATQEDDLLLSKKRKKGGALRKSPTKRNTNTANEDYSGNNNGINGPIRKKDTLVPQRMLGPKPFPLERLIAITDTILPVELRSLAKSQDILQEVRNTFTLVLDSSLANLTEAKSCFTP